LKPIHFGFVRINAWDENGQRDNCASRRLEISPCVEGKGKGETKEGKEKHQTGVAYKKTSIPLSQGTGKKRLYSLNRK